MSFRISAADFERNPVSIADSSLSDEWKVCDEYQISGGNIVASYTYKDDEHWRTYSPLEEVPDLFLRFAKVHEEPDKAVAMLKFVHRYGLPDGRKETNSEETLNVRPDRMEVKRLLHEVERAWVVLSLYEAAISDYSAKAGYLLREHEHIRAVQRFAVHTLPDEDERLPAIPSRELFSAIICSMTITHSIVEEFCKQRPLLSLKFHGVASPFKIDYSWQFHNLIGAMYLQMLWLMKSNDQLTRCLNCNLVISLARSQPNGRKTRSDRKFCGDACRQAHHRRLNR